MFYNTMSALAQVFTRSNDDMDKIAELEKKKDYDSILVILKDQISFLDGYITGEKEQYVKDVIYSMLRDRRILVRVFNTAKKLELLETATDNRIANLVHKITQIEKELQIRKEGI